MPKVPEGLTKAHFRVEFVIHFAFRKATVRASCQIVSSLSFLRVIIGAIGHLPSHKDNTKEMRNCPVFLGKQHDYLKPSQ